MSSNEDIESTFRFKILLDATFLFDQYEFRGIGRYGKELYSRLIQLISEDKLWELHIVGFKNLEKNLIKLGLSDLAIEDISSKIEFHSLGEPVVSGIKSLRIWDKQYVPIINDIKPHIFFAAHFERGLPSTKGYAKRLYRVPKTIVTGHDTIPLITQSFSQKSIIHNFIKKYFYLKMWTGISNADLVLSISDHTKRDMITYGGVNEDHIKTIHLGVDDTFDKSNFSIEEDEEKSILNKFSLETKSYYLYDSGIEANKGVEYLAEIFAGISKSKNSAKKLVITGGDFLIQKDNSPRARTAKGHNFLVLAEKFGIKNSIITTDKVTEEELRVLYFNAFGHLNFSTYEGFNLGPVQAMKAGILSIAANASCNPEITKGGSYLANLDNIKKTIKDLKKLLSDSKEIAKFIKKGKSVASTYTWDKTALETWQAIKSLVD